MGWIGRNGRYLGRGIRCNRLRGRDRGKGKGLGWNRGWLVGIGQGKV